MFYFVRPIAAWEAAHPSVAAFQSVSGTQRALKRVALAPGPEDIGENLCEEPLSFSGSLNTQMARMIRPLQMCRSPL